MDLKKHTPQNQQELIQKLIQRQGEKRLHADMAANPEPQNSGLAFVSIFIIVTFISVALLKGCEAEQENQVKAAKAHQEAMR